MPISSRRGAALALAGLALLAGGCAEQGAGAGAQAKKPTSLDEALGLDTASMQERQRKVQEAIRSCMRAEGFEYVPVDPSQSNMRIITPDSQDTSEFRRTKGYGISTTFDDTPEAGQAQTDPNQKIRDGLSEEEKKAYDLALFGQAAKGLEGGARFAIRVGPGSSEDQGGEEAPPPLEEAGCFGKAQKEVGGGPSQFDTIGPKMEELMQRIESDPRLVRANAAWSACMTRAGHSFEKPEDIHPFLHAKLSKLIGDGDGDGDGLSGGSGLMLARPGARAGAPPVDRDELAKLQREELEVAKADDDCSNKTGRRETAKKVRAELEKQFLEENPNLGEG